MSFASRREIIWRRLNAVLILLVLFLPIMRGCQGESVDYGYQFLGSGLTEFFSIQSESIDSRGFVDFSSKLTALTYLFGTIAAYLLLFYFALNLIPRGGILNIIRPITFLVITVSLYRQTRLAILLGFTQFLWGTWILIGALLSVGGLEIYVLGRTLARRSSKHFPAWMSLRNFAFILVVFWLFISIAGVWVLENASRSESEDLFFNEVEDIPMFTLSYEEVEAALSGWMDGAEFEHAFENRADVFIGIYPSAGIYTYLGRSQGGFVENLLITYLQFAPEDIEESPELAALIETRNEFIEQVITTYVSYEAHIWVLDNIPYGTEQSSKETFDTDYGPVSVRLSMREDDTVNVFVSFETTKP